MVSCISAHDPQLARLADAIAQRVGQQRFHVWFNNSTRLDLKQDGLEIAVPNDFISEWIGKNFTRPIQDAACEVLGGPLSVRFSVAPELFEVEESRGAGGSAAAGRSRSGSARLAPRQGQPQETAPTGDRAANAATGRDTTSAPRAINGSVRPGGGTPRLRHDLDSFVVGPGNQLAHTAASYVAEYPGGQYNPLFIHGHCGLGKTHLLQGLCRRFIRKHPTKRWMYLTGEEFTNEFLHAMRAGKLDAFRRRVRELDLLVIDDVHFLGGKKATQEEFLHTFNSIEAMGRQVVMASDSHPKMIEEFGESLINRFMSGMVVRIDVPNFATRCEILSRLATRAKLGLPKEVIEWIARRVTQNVRELEGAVTRIVAHVKVAGRGPDLGLAQAALGDLDRQLVAPVKPENVMQAVCDFFAVEPKDLMSGRRHRTVSLARSMAMYLIRKTGKLSFPEIGMKMGKRNHSTVISACRRVEAALEKNEPLSWNSAVGEREEEALEVLQRLEEQCRAMG